jgi:hypothetical protein
MPVLTRITTAGHVRHLAVGWSCGTRVRVEPEGYEGVCIKHRVLVGPDKRTLVLVCVYRNYCCRHPSGLRHRVVGDVWLPEGRLRLA